MEVETAYDGLSGLDTALSGKYDLILLDLMLPGMDGFSVCKRLREKLDVPILMVTARADDVDKIRGLGFGADDYIEKPFSPSVLFARVKANLSQYRRLKPQPAKSAIVEAGPLRIDTEAHTAAVRGQQLALTNKEYYELLLFLARHPNQVFSREDLYELIWGAGIHGRQYHGRGACQPPARKGGGESLQAAAHPDRLGRRYGAAVTVLAGAFTDGIYHLSSLFLGFVLVSIPLVMREQRAVLGAFRQNWLPFLAGVVLVVGLSALHLSALVNSLAFSVGTALYAFAAGALAISAMVLPGISGSSLLMSCGLYLPVIAAMKDFQFGQFWLLTVAGLGVLVGFAVAPHWIRRWMRKAPGAVTYAVLGMMLGSLYAIVVGPTTLKVPQHVMTLSDFHMLWFVLGIAVMLSLEALKKRVENVQAY